MECKGRGITMLQLFKKRLRVEDQYANVSKYGIKLKEEISLHRILDFDVIHYESKPYRLILISLGSGIYNEDDKFSYASDDIWHFDTECIYDHGDYVKIVQRLFALSKQELRISDLQDFVDTDEGVAWVEFLFDGQRIHLDLRVNDDWVDPSIFTSIIKICGNKRTQGNFTYLDLGGQDCLIGYCSEQNFKKLRKITKLDFQWLR